MEQEQLQYLIKWLNQQIMHSKESIQGAKEENNYGRVTQCEGMHDAFERCLNQIGKS